MSLNNNVRTVEIPRSNQQGIIGSRITSRLTTSRRGGLMLEQSFRGRRVFLDSRAPKLNVDSKQHTFEICGTNGDASVLFARLYDPKTPAKTAARSSASLPALRIGIVGGKIVALNRKAVPAKVVKARVMKQDGRPIPDSWRHASPEPDYYALERLSYESNGFTCTGAGDFEESDECEGCGEVECICDEAWAHLPVRLSGSHCCGHYECRCDGSWMGVPVHTTAATGLF
jgi:hypothetical protein